MLQGSASTGPTRPPATASRASRSWPAPFRTDRTRSRSTPGPPRRPGTTIGDEVPVVTSGTQARLEPTLVGIADFADGGSLNGASLTIFDTTTAQALFLDGEDAYTDLWVTAEEGVSQEELRDAVAAELPDGVEAVTGDDAADESANALLEAISASSPRSCSSSPASPWSSAPS